MKKSLLLCVVLVCLLKEGVMAQQKEIQLPRPRARSEVSLEEAIAKRRSVRNFSGKDFGMEEISQLLWAAQGITGKGGFRSAPSAGALYPMELYLLSKDGLFHYIPKGHKLEILGSEDLRKKLSGAALGQSSVRNAAIDIVICGVPDRITRKYGERGIRYMHMEAGHIAQNIHLQAVALGLGSVPVGAFNDKEVDKILGLPADCNSLYIIPVGYK